MAKEVNKIEEFNLFDTKAREDIEKLSSQYKDIAKQISASNVAIKDIFANNELPRIYMTSDKLGTLSSKNDGEANCECEIKINNKTIKGYATGKVQGTTSATFPGKNFTFKFFKDVSHTTKLKIDVGWGEQSKYCFKKNWVDTTHTRNISGARIAYDMVESRPSSDFKTNLQTAPRNGVVDGFPCKLYINGEFWGLYTWNIPKDDWMFNMDSDNPNHMVLCAEQNNNGNTINDNVLRCEFRKEWDGSDGSSWSIEVGTLSDALKNSFNRCVNFTINSSDQEFHDNISDYFDLYSLLDYILFSRFVCHLDGLAKNMLMVTYDGIHWGAILYDMDSIYGAWYDGSRFVATDYKCPEQYQETNSLLWQRIETCFVDELKARYNELRQGALSLGNIITHVEEIYDLIPDRVFNDDKAKWTAMPSLNTNTITRFRNYMRDRAVYVDNYINNLVEPKPCTDITLNNSTLSFTSTDTQTLTATVTPSDTTDIITWSVSPSGICTIDNGVVTPIINGSCTITATCGSKTATCAVTVVLPSTTVTGLNLNNNSISIPLYSNIDDYGNINYVEGFSWMDGAINDTGVVNGTDKYVTLENLPTGKYRFSSNNVNYTYKKVYMKYNDVYILRNNPGNNNTDVDFYIPNKNCKVYLSLFPNNLEFDANNITVKNITGLEEEYKNIDATSIFCKSSINTANYIIASITLTNLSSLQGKNLNIISSILANISIGDRIYDVIRFKQTVINQDNVNILTENANKWVLSSYLSTVYATIAIPSSEYPTFDDLQNYITNNSLKIFVNNTNGDSFKTNGTTNLVATLEPTNANNKNVTWTTNNENVELVANGLDCTVKAKAVGSSVVTCTSADTTNGTISDTCNVTIS